MWILMTFNVFGGATFVALIKEPAIVALMNSNVFGGIVVVAGALDWPLDKLMAKESSYIGNRVRLARRRWLEGLKSQ